MGKIIPCKHKFKERQNNYITKQISFLEKENDQGNTRS